MSTNYYHRFNVCDCCGRYDEQHIGKSGFGWEFSFRSYLDDEDKPFIVSWEDWKRILQSEDKIFDEYGRKVSYENFVGLVEKSKGKKNHYDYLRDSPQYGSMYLKDEFKDSEGWSFSRTPFS